MSGWTEVARREEIPPGGAKPVVIDDRMIAVIDLDGELYAIDNVCTHAFAILTDGFIEGDLIQCPLHAARFNIRTGEVASPPAYEPLQTYEVRVENDKVFVRLD